MQNDINKRELAYNDYLAGMKYKQIADKYEISLSAVKSWATRYWKQEKVATTKEKKLQPKNEKVATIIATKKIIENDIVNSRLNERQRLFCQYYIKNFNATQAYLKAYGCDYDTANRNGHRLLISADIKAEVLKLKEIKNKSLFATGEDVVDMHMRIAFADISDFVEFRACEEPIMAMYGPVTIQDENTGEKKPLTQEVNKMLFKDSDSIDGQLICEVSEGRNGTKIKLENRQKSLDFLGRYFELNPMDRHKKDYDMKKIEIHQKQTDGISDFNINVSIDYGESE